MNALAPTLQHVSVRVKAGRMAMAKEFMTEALGWQIEDRTASWGTGHSLFFRHPSGQGLTIQITEESLGDPGVTTDAFHLAFVVQDFQKLLQKILHWAHVRGVETDLDDLGQGKAMLWLHDLFFGCLELIPAPNPTSLAAELTGSTDVA